jgi:hypothetical protein
MAEGGKRFTLRTMVMAAAQHAGRASERVDVRLYGWTSQARQVSAWQVGDEFPDALLACGGASDWGSLIRLLGDKPDGKILIFTDGFWPREGAKHAKRWMEQTSPDTLRVIRIGADADTQLKGPHVFAAEDFFAAVDGWLGAGST